MTSIQELLSASPAVVLAFVLTFIGYALKQAPKFPNWLIPFALPVIGAAVFYFVGEISQSVEVRNAGVARLLYGFGIGCGSVGLNQMLRQWQGRNLPNEPDEKKA